MRWLLPALVIFQGALSSAQSILPSNPGMMPSLTEWSLPGIYKRSQVFNSSSFPMRTIGQLVTGPNGGSCTGTLIGPRHVLTAAHCVFDRKDQAWATDIKFYPGRLSYTGMAQGVYDWEKIYIPKAYAEIGERTSWSAYESDYAVIYLKQPVGDSLGWMGIARADEQVYPLEVSVAGYPGDKDYGTLWSVSCPVSVYDSQLRMRCDVFGGMSGSGIKTNTPKGPVIVGVFDWGAEYPEDVTKGDNGGVAISKDVFNKLQTWLIDQSETPYGTTILRNKDKKIAVHFENNCPKARPAKVAFLYKNLEGIWVTSFGWMDLEVGARKLAFNTLGKDFYYFAESTNLIWQGKDTYASVQNKTIGFIKKDLGDRPGVYTMSLTCP